MLTATTRGPASPRLQRLAVVISVSTSPKITIFALLFYIAAVIHTSSVQIAFLVSYAVLALALLRFLQRNAATSDSHEFSDPAHRRTRYATFLLFIGLCSSFIYFGQTGEQADFETQYFLTAALTTLVLLIVTRTFHFKMSAHVTFLGVGVLFLAPAGIHKYLYFTIAGAIIGWARIKLENHSNLQIVTTMGYIFIVFLLWDQRT